MDLSAANGITLAHGGCTVCLRPSLRAAIILERLHGGFTGLFRRLRDFDTATITTVIEQAATDQRQASTFLGTIANAPLKGFYQAAQAPLFSLCETLIPAPQEPNKNASKGKIMPWAEVYRELYRIGTGWLHWSPEATWNATPDEITEAFQGHMAKLKAIHGTADDDDQTTEDQRKRNLAAGLDPEFDRDGLRALKAKLT